MPDLLILANQDQLSFELQRFAEGRKCRVKIAYELPTVLSWLDTWNFDALIVPPSISIADQHQIADRLWRDNWMAPFVIFDPSGTRNTQVQESRLSGVDVIWGNDVWNALERVITSIKPKSYVSDSNLRVLVVEDLDSPRHIICAYLEEMGAPAVEGVNSAQKALAALRATPDQYLCVLTDIRMPIMTGDALIREIRADSKLAFLPIIVLTAYGTPDYLMDCLKAGATGFLTKPPKKKDLQRELGRATRILARKASPRLANPDDVEALRDVLVNYGTR